MQDKNKKKALVGLPKPFLKYNTKRSKVNNTPKQ